MAAAATEEDTELRDLLVQTLESSGVLNKIKVGGRRASRPRTCRLAGRGERWLAPAAANGPSERGGGWGFAGFVPSRLLLPAGVPGWGPLSASRPGGGACFARGAAPPLGPGLGEEPSPAPAVRGGAGTCLRRSRGPEARPPHEVCPAAVGAARPSRPGRGRGALGRRREPGALAERFRPRRNRVAARALAGSKPAGNNSAAGWCGTRWIEFLSASIRKASVENFKQGFLRVAV